MLHAGNSHGLKEGCLSANPWLLHSMPLNINNGLENRMTTYQARMHLLPSIFIVLLVKIYKFQGRYLSDIFTCRTAVRLGDALTLSKLGNKIKGVFKTNSGLYILLLSINLFFCFFFHSFLHSFPRPINHICSWVFYRLLELRNYNFAFFITPTDIKTITD